MRQLVRGTVRLLAWALLLVVVAAAGTLTACRYQAASREGLAPSQAAPATGRLVDAGDTKIYVQQMGPDDAPAVLFVHGTGAWSGLWQQTLERTAHAGFRAIAIDVPPFGFSEKPSHLSYSKAPQGMRIVKVLESLAIPRVILVGHSFGAGPTVEAALLQPDRVAQLILVDGALNIQPAGASLDHSTIASQLTHRLLRWDPVRDAIVATFVTNPRFTRKLLQMMIADPAKATDEVVLVLQQPMQVQGTTAAVGRWLPELADSHTLAASQTPTEYSKLTMPVTLLWGELDTVTPMAQAQRLHELMPQARLQVLNKVGHIPQVEDPAAFNDALIHALTSS